MKGHEAERHHPMWSFIFKGGKSAGKRLQARKFARIPLFQHLSKRELLTITDIVHHRTYEDKEYVFKKGQPGAAMFIVASGEVRIIDRDEDCNEVQLAVLGEGTFFGELALLDDSPRSASAVAAEATDIYAFFRNDLLKLLKADPHISSNIYRSLAIIIGDRLRKTNEQLFDK